MTRFSSPSPWTVSSLSILALGMIALSSLPSCKEIESSPISGSPEPVPQVSPTSSPVPAPTPARIGDAAVSYMNPEFSSDGRWMVWFEPSPTGPKPDGRLYGTVWHCAVDPETGALTPADGRGFAAFPATIWSRANLGADSEGVFYAGQFGSDAIDARNGKLVVVRPQAPDSGTVTVLDTASQPKRRSIFPSSLTDREQNEQFIWWLENDVGFTPSQAEQVSLKYISLGAPTVEHTVTVQAAPGPSWSAMDTTYARILSGTSILTLGVPVSGSVEVATFDLQDPGAGLTPVTTDGLFKLDPYSFKRGSEWFFLAGINGTEESKLYRSSDLRSPFTAIETIVQPSELSEIADGYRCQPQSHQIFELSGRLFSAYQIADCSDSGGSFLTRPGEIWLTSLQEAHPTTVRISHSGPDAKNEPETVVGSSSAWVFYNAYPAGSNPLTAQYELWRVEVR